MGTGGVCAGPRGEPNTLPPPSGRRQRWRRLWLAAQRTVIFLATTTTTMTMMVKLLEPEAHGGPFTCSSLGGACPWACGIFDSLLGIAYALPCCNELLLSCWTRKEASQRTIYTVAYFWRSKIYILFRMYSKSIFKYCIRKYSVYSLIPKLMVLHFLF